MMSKNNQAQSTSSIISSMQNSLLGTTPSYGVGGGSDIDFGSIDLNR